jgi:RimJ/RimL family protein N-acetyltransferase
MNVGSLVTVLETERLILREIDSALDAEFIFELLNSPGFIKYIGDRGVRNPDDSRDFIETRYRQSYRDHGYGLYAAVLKESGTQVGMCGFVRRDTLPGPDIGFAFLPEHEGKGYGYESATGVMKFGREKLGFEEVFAITTLDNAASMKLLGKLGFSLLRVIDMPEGERLNLFSSQLPKP